MTIETDRKPNDENDLNKTDAKSLGHQPARGGHQVGRHSSGHRQVANERRAGGLTRDQ